MRKIIGWCIFISVISSFFLIGGVYSPFSRGIRDNYLKKGMLPSSLSKLHYGLEVFASNKNITKGLEPYVKSLEEPQKGMTLWQMVKAGGFIMFILFLLSIITTAIVIYNFITLKVSKLCPQDFFEKVLQKLKKKNDKAARSICENKSNLIARVVLSGLNIKDKEEGSIREGMESCVRKEIANLWQFINYLADISAIAPLIGLLGTVLGMIQAFNVIAFQTIVVKPILLAGGVSKAMVTTAGGLIVAIFAVVFYTYFKSKISQISNIVESYTTELITIIEKSAKRMSHSGNKA